MRRMFHHANSSGSGVEDIECLVVREVKFHPTLSSCLPQQIRYKSQETSEILPILSVYGHNLFPTKCLCLSHYLGLRVLSNLLSEETFQIMQ